MPYNIFHYGYPQEQKSIHTAVSQTVTRANLVLCRGLSRNYLMRGANSAVLSKSKLKPNMKYFVLPTVACCAYEGTVYWLLFTFFGGFVDVKNQEQGKKKRWLLRHSRCQWRLSLLSPMLSIDKAIEHL